MKFVRYVTSDKGFSRGQPLHDFKGFAGAVGTVVKIYFGEETEVGKGDAMTSIGVKMNLSSNIC